MDRYNSRSHPLQTSPLPSAGNEVLQALTTSSISSDDTLFLPATIYESIQESGSVADSVQAEVAGAPMLSPPTPGHRHATSAIDLIGSCGPEAPRIPTASVSSAEFAEIR